MKYLNETFGLALWIKYPNEKYEWMNLNETSKCNRNTFYKYVQSVTSKVRKYNLAHRIEYPNGTSEWKIQM